MIKITQKDEKCRMYKTVIWDFNGTVLDDAPISVKAIDIVLGRRKMKKIENTENFRKYFEFPVEKYYCNIGFDFSKEPYEIPADEWVRLYDEFRHEAGAVPGVREALEKFKNAGMKQIILSACEKNILKTQICEMGLSEYFDEILGTTDVYAVGKAELANEWAKNQNDDIFPAVFIGDTDHDFLCSKKIGCDCILYSGGYMSKERLMPLGAVICDTMEEISSIILEK